MSDREEDYLAPYKGTRKSTNDYSSNSVLGKTASRSAVDVDMFQIMANLARDSIIKPTTKDMYNGEHPGIILHAEKVPIGNIGGDSVVLAEAAAMARCRAFSMSSPRARATPTLRSPSTSGLPKRRTWVSATTSASVKPL